MSSAAESGSRVEARRFGRTFQFVFAVVIVLGAMAGLSAWSMLKSPLPKELAPYSSSAGGWVDGDFYGVDFYVDGYTEAEMTALLKRKLPRKSIGKPSYSYSAGTSKFPDIELGCRDEQLECRVTFWHKMGFFEAQLRERDLLR